MPMMYTCRFTCSGPKLQGRLNTIVDEGERYGLELNWGCFFVMGIHNTVDIYQPSGEALKVPGQAVYLGGMLTCSAVSKPEVTRRLGEAIGCFEALNQCWSHTNVTSHRKVHIYMSCIVSKLLYNLHSL